MNKYLNLRTLLFFVTCFCLIGCATSYKPEGLGGGYSEMAMSENMYRVSFRGNSYTSRGAVQDSLLRRCAELTLNKGYKYFVILKAQPETRTLTYNKPATINTSSTGTVYMNNGSAVSNTDSTTTFTPATTQTIESYKNTVFIKMLNSNKNDPLAVDAAIVLQNFHTKF